MADNQGVGEAGDTRVAVLRLVKTPLAFFTLVVLVVEAAMLGAALTLLQGGDRTLLVVGSLGLMFLVVAVVGSISVWRPEALSGRRRNGYDDDSLPASEKIALHREAIERLTAESVLRGFNVPEGYKSEVSELDKLAFGFCYPDSWEYAPLPESIHYGTAIDFATAQSRGFARNLNVLIDDISTVTVPLEQLYGQLLRKTLAVLRDAELALHDEDFVFQGLRASRWAYSWTPEFSGCPRLVSYQIIVADADRKNLYTISFTTTAEDFDESRSLFDNIAATFRL